MYLYENTVYVFCVEFCHADLGKSNVQVSANQIYQVLYQKFVSIASDVTFWDHVLFVQ